MRHLARWLCVAGVLALASRAWALGMGDVAVSSRLNEPVQARIVLRDAQGLSAEEVKVALADDSAFSAAGIARTAAVDTLHPRVVQHDGRLAIVLEGTRPQREPYLDLVLDVIWPGGQLRRQLTLLLDPPAYADESSSTAAAAAARPDTAAASRAAAPAHGPQPVSRPASVAPPERRATAAAVARSERQERDVELAALAQQLSRLEARLDTLEQSPGPAVAPVVAAPAAPSASPEAVASLARQLQQLDARLSALDERQRAFDTRLDRLGERQQRQSSPLTSPVLPGGERSAHGLWDALAAWLNPLMIIAAGGVLVIVGLLLVRHQRARQEDMLPIEVDDLALDELDERMDERPAAAPGAAPSIPLAESGAAVPAAPSAPVAAVAAQEAEEGGGVAVGDGAPGHALASGAGAALDDVGPAEDVAPHVQYHAEPEARAVAEFSLVFDVGAPDGGAAPAGEASPFDFGLDGDLDAPLPLAPTWQEASRQYEPEAVPGHVDSARELEIETVSFPSTWSFEEVAFEALERDNGSPVAQSRHDERLVRAHVLLDAGDSDSALMLLRQILDEGPHASREAARLLVKRFDLHPD